MKFFPDALELCFNPLDLPPRRFPLGEIQFQGGLAGQPPMGAVHNRSNHLQIADQFGAGSRRSLLWRLPLRFEKQRRIVQNAFPDRGRSSPPSRVELPSLARIAVMLGQDRRHALAVHRALSRHRHQKLHGHLGRNLALAHLLLNHFRQKLD
jgi:hypothetical protein